jgi:hypothetical protein
MSLENETRQVVQAAKDDERQAIAERIAKLIEAVNATGMVRTYIFGLESALEVVVHQSNYDPNLTDISHE